jgi:hypothetical protein
MANRSAKVAVNIPNGSTTSTAVGVPSGVVVGIQFPATMTGTSVTLTSSHLQSGTYRNHYIAAGTALTIPFVASSTVQINANDVSALSQWIKVISNGTEGASRDLKLIIRDIK